MKLMLFTLTLTALFGTTVMAGGDMMQPYKTCTVVKGPMGVSTSVQINSGGFAFHYDASIIEKVIAPQALPRVADRVSFLKAVTDTARKLVLTGQGESGKSIKITIQKADPFGPATTAGQLVWGSRTLELSCYPGRK